MPRKFLNDYTSLAHPLWETTYLYFLIYIKTHYWPILMMQIKAYNLEYF